MPSPGGRSGHISVRLNEHDGVLDLEIEDDGIGIASRPAGWRPRAARGDGIGLQLIRGFSRQLGASLEVEEGHGTRYAVRLSLRPHGRQDGDAGAGRGIQSYRDGSQCVRLTNTL